MEFRLAHRGAFDPSAVAHSLRLRAPRVATPASWSWAWPLHDPASSSTHRAKNATAAAPSASSSSPSPEQPPSPPAPQSARHVWMSAVRAVAVSDDASYLVFLSYAGAVSVARPRRRPVLPLPLPSPPHEFPAPVAAAMPPEWYARPTAVALFHLPLPPPAAVVASSPAPAAAARPTALGSFFNFGASLNPEPLPPPPPPPSSSSSRALAMGGPRSVVLAVGYASGLVAFFDPATARLLFVSRPQPDMPVRNLRFYPTFTASSAAPEESLPAHSPSARPASATVFPSKAPTTTPAANTTATAPATAPAARYNTDDGGLFAVLAPATAARLPTHELLALLPHRAPAAALDEGSGLLGSASGGGAARPIVDLHGAGWTVWSLPAQDAVLDAAPCGPAPAAVCDLDPHPGGLAAAPLQLAIAGAAPPLVAYSASPRAAFSARAAAKRAATSMLSVARGFLFARMAPAEDDAVATAAAAGATASGFGNSASSASLMYGGVPGLDEGRTAVQAVASHTASWADRPVPVSSALNFADVSGTARKSVSAVLQRARRPADALAQVSPMQLAGLGSSTLDSGSGSNASPAGGGGGARFGSTFSNYSSKQGSGLGIDSSSPSFTSLSSTSIALDATTADVLAALPPNTRFIERIAAAPQPCALIAAADSLGRVFVQDSRDLCVVRVLKGYRDARIAWIPAGAGPPLLAVVAPRLDILELHGPLEQRRREAFRLPPGAALAQSASHNVFMVFPDGRLFELSNGKISPNADGKIFSTKGSSIAENTGFWGMETDEHDDTGKADGEEWDAFEDTDALEKAQKFGTRSPPDYELTGAFIEAVKSGRIGRAVECVQEVQTDAFKVAHLMASLVTCTSPTGPEVHVALSSSAAQIAARLQNPDLVCRFEAHRRLAEAFALLAVDAVTRNSARVSTTGSTSGTPLLRNDDIGTGLIEFLTLDPQYELNKKITNSNSKEGRKQETHIDNNNPGSFADDVSRITCEEFILSHAIEPTFETTADDTGAEYKIRARSDLNSDERRRLARAYFSRLVAPGPVDLPTVGREHPACIDVFVALTQLLVLSKTDVVRLFVSFFLHAPLAALLRSPVNVYDSPLRCAIVRLRKQFGRSVFDNAVLQGCDRTPKRVANAVLLLRLVVLSEDDFEGDFDGPNKSNMNNSKYTNNNSSARTDNTNNTNNINSTTRASSGEQGGGGDRNKDATKTGRNGSNTDGDAPDDGRVGRSHELLLAALDRADEILVYRRLVAGSKVSRERVNNNSTAWSWDDGGANGGDGKPKRGGVRCGEAERRAVRDLLRVNELERVAHVLAGGRQGGRSMEELGAKAAESVCEVALYACQKQTATLLRCADVDTSKIPDGVLEWIRAAETDLDGDDTKRAAEEDEKDLVMWKNEGDRRERIGQLRTVVLGALGHLSDSSVDAVRSLQLAEALSVLLEDRGNDHDNDYNNEEDENENENEKEDTDEVDMTDNENKSSTDAIEKT